MNNLQDLKNCGIKKVELICPYNCECCKKLRNKEIPIDLAIELPNKYCEEWKCMGRYNAVVEFDLN